MLFVSCYFSVFVEPTLPCKSSIKSNRVNGTWRSQADGELLEHPLFDIWRTTLAL